MKSSKISFSNAIALLVLALLATSSFKLETYAFSMSFTQKILENKQYVTVEGEVYFKRQGGILTTRLLKPFESVTIVNADGEMKNYDVRENVLIQSNSAFTSSESSYFWYFLNGSYGDLGLNQTGYVIKGTKLSDGLLITTWVPKEGFNSGIQKIELVHEKNLPIYIEFTGPKNKLLGKIFFSSFQKVGGLTLPQKITEIAYKGKSDSVVTSKSYFNPKINKDVDLDYLDFKIPANAKVVSGK